MRALVRGDLWPREPRSCLLAEVRRDVFLPSIQIQEARGEPAVSAQGNQEPDQWGREVEGQVRVKKKKKSSDIPSGLFVSSHLHR